MRINFVNTLFLLVFISCNAQENNLVVSENENEIIIGNNDEKGAKTGSWVFYNSSKTIKKILNYDNEGILEGSAYLFFDNGKIDKILTFKNGKLNGKVKFYSKKGELLAVYIYHNNIMKEIEKYILDEESPPRNHNYIPKWVM